MSQLLHCTSLLRIKLHTIIKENIRQGREEEGNKRKKGKRTRNSSSALLRKKTTENEHTKKKTSRRQIRLLLRNLMPQRAASSPLINKERQRPAHSGALVSESQFNLRKYARRNPPSLYTPQLPREEPTPARKLDSLLKPRGGARQIVSFPFRTAVDVYSCDAFPPKQQRQRPEKTKTQNEAFSQRQLLDSRQRRVHMYRLHYLASFPSRVVQRRQHEGNALSLTTTQDAHFRRWREGKGAFVYAGFHCIQVGMPLAERVGESRRDVKRFSRRYTRTRILGSPPFGPHKHSGDPARMLSGVRVLVVRLKKIKNKTLSICIYIFTAFVGHCCRPSISFQIVSILVFFSFLRERQVKIIIAFVIIFLPSKTRNGSFFVVVVP